MAKLERDWEAVLQKACVLGRAITLHALGTIIGRDPMTFYEEVIADPWVAHWRCYQVKTLVMNQWPPAWREQSLTKSIYGGPMKREKDYGLLHLKKFPWPEAKGFARDVYAKPNNFDQEPEPLSDAFGKDQPNLALELEIAFKNWKERKDEETRRAGAQAA